MNTSKSILLLSLVFLSYNSTAQNLILQKGNRTKEIAIGKIIAIHTTNTEGIYDRWNFEAQLGELISIEEATINLRIYRKSNLVSQDKKMKAGEVMTYNEDSLRQAVSIFKSEIKQITVWGNREEAIKNRKNWFGVGALVYAVGVFTPWIAISFDDQDKQDNAMIVAISMVLAGAITANIAQPKTIITSNDLRKNKNKKYWEIQ